MRSWLIGCAAIVALLAVTPPASAQLNEPKPNIRTLVTLTAVPSAPSTATALIQFNKLVGDTATSNVTTYPVTAGKTLRIISVWISLYPSTTTGNQVGISLRTLSSGACLVGSPVVTSWSFAMPPGTLSTSQGQTGVNIPIPEGLEFSGSTRNICVTQGALNATGQLSFSILGYEY